MFASESNKSPILCSSNTFFNSDKPVIFPDITYSFYDVWADLYRIPYKQLPLAEDFTINPEDYNIPNGGVVIANPNAPTGVKLPLEAIEDIIKNNLFETAETIFRTKRYLSGMAAEFSVVEKLVRNRPLQKIKANLLLHLS